MKLGLLLFTFLVGFSLTLVAQGPGLRPPGPPPHRQGEPPGLGGRGGPGGREHTATEAGLLQLLPADERPPARNKVKIRERSDEVSIQSNGMPDHLIGEFPNPGNPNEVREQDYDIVFPADPEEASFVTRMQGDSSNRHLRVFGVTLDGVFLEPGTAEFWMGRRENGWNYEALGGAVPLGLDANYGHVQPDGNYHYHGLPTGLMNRLGHEAGKHSPLIGWAADGFPVYSLYGYKSGNDPLSEVVELKSSFALKEGSRPGGSNAPSGGYDGAFFEDYEFIPGSGDLDECNGRFCITPDYPDGTYAYFLTREWPVVPRAFRGTPVALKPPGGAGGPEGIPGRGGPPQGRPPGGRPPRPF
ncbi:MAG: YHYH protein [Verrucomicrobiales bacterium]|nr:YHYH protein [Verrucomicrobiales bacterium]